MLESVQSQNAVIHIFSSLVAHSAHSFQSYRSWFWSSPVRVNLNVKIILTKKKRYEITRMVTAFLRLFWCVVNMSEQLIIFIAIYYAINTWMLNWVSSEFAFIKLCAHIVCGEKMRYHYWYRMEAIDVESICSNDLSFSAYCRLYLRSSTANWKGLIVDGNNYIKSDAVRHLSQYPSIDAKHGFIGRLSIRRGIGNWYYVFSSLLTSIQSQLPSIFLLFFVYKAQEKVTE